MSKKLNKFRYTPRINPSSGNEMKLLSEEEEDAYLDEKMQAEEDVFSVDYDVWIDEKTGETHIEKYDGRLGALQCDRCGLMTLKLEREEVLKPASSTEDGELLKHYKCGYCGRIKREEVKLSLHKRGDDFNLSQADVAMVKLEIHKSGGVVEDYQFQNIEETERFLHEMNVPRLETAIEQEEIATAD